MFGLFKSKQQRDEERREKAIAQFHNLFRCGYHVADSLQSVLARVEGGLLPADPTRYWMKYRQGELSKEQFCQIGSALRSLFYSVWIGEKAEDGSWGGSECKVSQLPSFANLVLWGLGFCCAVECPGKQNDDLLSLIGPGSAPFDQGGELHGEGRTVINTYRAGGYYAVGPVLFKWTINSLADEYGTCCWHACMWNSGTEYEKKKEYYRRADCVWKMRILHHISLLPSHLKDDARKIAFHMYTQFPEVFPVVLNLSREYRWLKPLRALAESLKRTQDVATILLAERDYESLLKTYDESGKQGELIFTLLALGRFKEASKRLDSLAAGRGSGSLVFPWLSAEVNPRFQKCLREWLRGVSSDRPKESGAIVDSAYEMIWCMHALNVWHWSLQGASFEYRYPFDIQFTKKQWTSIGRDEKCRRMSELSRESRCAAFVVGLFSGTSEQSLQPTTLVFHMERKEWTTFCDFVDDFKPDWIDLEAVAYACISAERWDVLARHFRRTGDLCGALLTFERGKCWKEYLALLEVLGPDGYFTKIDEQGVPAAWESSQRQHSTYEQRVRQVRALLKASGT